MKFHYLRRFSYSFQALPKFSKGTERFLRTFVGSEAPLLHPQAFRSIRGASAPQKNAYKQKAPTFCVIHENWWLHDIFPSKKMVHRIFFIWPTNEIFMNCNRKNTFHIDLSRILTCSPNTYVLYLCSNGFWLINKFSVFWLEKLDENQLNLIEDGATKIVSYISGPDLILWLWPQRGQGICLIFWSRTSGAKAPT